MSQTGSFKALREKIILRDVDKAAAQKLADELSIPLAAASILAGRRLTTYDQCKNFFRSKLDNFHDPFIFKDMEKAAARVKQAIDNGEKIVIYGDYDVDGVTSTALVIRVLKRLGCNCDYYLPNRLTEGYGMSETGVRHAAESGAALIITVDCGVTACKEAELASSLGMDVIITDHHEPKDGLPAAVAVINPKLHDCPYPDKSLAGVGIALKLCQAIGKFMGRGSDLWSDLLDLAALGTAADIVPMTGESRIITALGFELIQNSAVTGLKALIEAQGLTGKRLSTSQVVFQLAPCINAVGRLGDPGRGVELLLTEDPALAAVYARELKEANLSRRALDSLVAEEAFKWVEANCTPENDYGLVAANSDWHVGVIGIVASKVVERFSRPSILISIGEDGLAKGSGRSVSGFHLLDALNDCKDILESYGGHAAAAGLSLQANRIDAFREKFNAAVKSKTTIENLAPRVTADIEVSIDELTPKLLRIINQMEPFGPSNMRPVLLCRGLKHRYPPKIVGQKHLKLSLTNGSIVMDAIAFGMGGRFTEARNAKSVNVAFALEENEWNGKVSLQMNVKGMECAGET
ncbi:MAG: single-stranded-DNA-specific exonuclease RecJ [Chitinispirillia bacterium]|nr:single-stranded-DNA-specific exonuclease RecJ [Chitinispirillia bacterium]MCL2242130.1 single-stranded-DNA-specific exonuclease RecJ [Chitinispirillia bacterium]